ncbi:Na-translocating system protein MpsC family protein [Anaerobacillus alkaliphilus]|uniref:Na-translocating system protein MpsC family protein n=1 Tax=Anaerobacillus alkaliphilus TaxID=1548597 RepID=UPI001375DC7F|nr:Na-translocating system protein MpsC family protein [Anaerobacillus alkaliphilus]
MTKTLTNNRTQDNLLHLGSLFSKMLKQRFGKGPETCLVTIYDSRLTVFIRKYITPAEEVLIESNQYNLAYEFRNVVIAKVIDEFVEEAKVILGHPLHTYFCDWDYEKNTGVIVIDNGKSYEYSESMISTKLKGKLAEQIARVSSGVHKVPSSIDIIKLNQNMFAVECQETMLEVEKVLFRKDCMDILQERSREIKKSYVNQRELFELAFGRVIEGLFMTWDFKNDRSYIFFYLQ